MEGEYLWNSDLSYDFVCIQGSMYIIYIYTHVYPQANTYIHLSILHIDFKCKIGFVLVPSFDQKKWGDTSWSFELAGWEFYTTFQIGYNGQIGVTRGQTARLTRSG